MAQEAEAPAKFVALKTATLDLSALCSRKDATEAELRQGMEVLDDLLNEMEDLWRFVNANKRDAYEKEGEATLVRALKCAKKINPNINSVEDALDIRIPCRELIVTRSRKTNDQANEPTDSPTDEPNADTEAGQVQGKNGNSVESNNDINEIQGNVENGSADVGENGVSNSETVSSGNNELSEDRAGTVQNVVDPRAGDEGKEQEIGRKDSKNSRQRERYKDQRYSSRERHDKDRSGDKKKRDRSKGRRSRSRSKGRRHRSKDRRSRSRSKGRHQKTSRKKRDRSRSSRASGKSSRHYSSSSDSSSSQESQSSKSRKQREKRSGRSRARSRSLSQSRKTNGGKNRSRSRSPRPSYKDDRYKGDRQKGDKKYGGYKQDRYRNLPPYGDRGRDRAHSWGQSQYYPSEERSRFVAPAAESRFTDLNFPSNWALPSERDFKRYFDRVDVLPLLGKPMAFGMFDGQIPNYPGWQENFYRVVHVQAVPLIHKINALDQAVSTDVKNKYFKDLTSTAEDYLLRIRRLEEKFGGPGKHLSTMIQRIKAVKDAGNDLAKLQDAVFALERFLESRFCRDPDDPLMSEIIRPSMREEVREQYRAFKADNRLADTPRTILAFFKRMMEVKEDKDKQNKETFKAKNKPEKKKNSKTEKKDEIKKANYQFHNHGYDSSDNSFAEESFEDSSEEEGRLNWQTKESNCDFCKGLHNIFQCIKFFFDLTYGQRRKWVIKEKRCPFCLRIGHRRSNCDRKRACRFCKGDHNSCIHVEPKKEKQKSSEPEKKNKRSSDEGKGHKTIKKDKITAEALGDVFSSSTESDEANVHSSRSSRSVGNNPVSLTTFVARIRDPLSGKLTQVNALADGGADHTILAARTARDLGLWKEGCGSNYYVKGHGGSKGCYTAQKFLIELLDPKGNVIRTIKTSSYEEPCGDLQVENWQTLKSNWKHLANLPLEAPVGDGKVDLVLGTSCLDLMEALEAAVFGPPGGPVAKRTKIGWIVGGKTVSSSSDSEKTGRLNFSMHHQPGHSQETSGSQGSALSLRNNKTLQKQMDLLKRDFECELSELKEKHRQTEAKLRQNLQQIWGRNECCKQNLRNGISPAIETDLEKKAREIFRQSRKTDSEGFAEVGLIWRGNERPKNNGSRALGIFLGMERRMKTQPGLYEAFTENIQEWVSKGYARTLSLQDKGRGFFIPTFMVVREDKATTKYRLIVNGKFEFDGHCINDFLLSGPNVMNRLADVLLRFRYHKYVLTCDIANMFLRVKVPRQDRKYLRFFYRNPSGQIEIIEMCSHAFGLTQSPFVVINVVKELALQKRTEYPLASAAALRDSIVDDILTGTKTFQSLKTVHQEIVELFKHLQMDTHKWATNSPGLREIIPESDQAACVSLGEESSELSCNDGEKVASVKCLGILWHPASDKLQFVGSDYEKHKEWTMREMSSRASKLFDPLGLMTPLVLEGKLLLQGLWKLGLDWDDQVPDEIAKAFNRWIRRCSSVHLCHIERRVKGSFKPSLERLVVFTDASGQAQAAAAYLWCQNTHDGSCEGRLWAAKQKISSLNRAESISRLELEGALIGVQLAKQVCSAMGWDMAKVQYFTDSTTVLWWLRTNRELDVFVGNRICRILDYSSLHQWYHVRTSENPADIPTRGMSGKRLAKCDLWWTGPPFFKLQETEWPKQPEVVETRASKEGYRREEKRRIEKWFQHSTCENASITDPRTGWRDDFWAEIVGKYGDLGKGFRVASRVYELLGKFSRYNFATTTYYANKGLQLCVLRSVQSKELIDLKAGLEKGEVNKTYESLRPFLDSFGLIRVGGRLKHSYRLPLSTRCPVLLDGEKSYARMLLEHVHRNELRHCGGKRTLMAEVRWNVWITHLASLARKVVRSCVWCNRSSKQAPVKMSSAPLHYTRLPLANGCAFSEIGLDMAGPFSAKHGRSRAVSKRYILLFSCCWTRALSLEVIDSASTESCVLAFLRHTNTFGFPRYVNSDRGSNLVGLDRHLQTQWAVVEKELTKRSLEWGTIKWNFNPPYSPRFTGHVEVMVKITKTCLRRLLGQSRYLFRDEELQTLVKVAQGYANMRPLTAPSSDLDDAPPLTPADFLMTGNRFLGGIPELDFDLYDAKNRKEMLGKITRELWESLTKEYVLEMQKYSKVKGENSLKKGDIVFILDRTLPSGRYAVGRIDEEIRNPDGKARSFIVDYQGDKLKRSIMTLAPLAGI